MGCRVHGGFCSEEQLIKELKADLDELNNGLPKFLDSDTRLDKISLSGKVVVSTHTYTRYSYSEVDPVYLRQTVEKNAKQQLCTNSKDFILFGYSYRYDYFGKYNQKITSVYFNKDTCGY